MRGCEVQGELGGAAGSLTPVGKSAAQHRGCPAWERGRDVEERSMWACGVAWDENIAACKVRSTWKVSNYVRPSIICMGLRRRSW